MVWVLSYLRLYNQLADLRDAGRLAAAAAGQALPLLYLVWDGKSIPGNRPLLPLG